MKLTNKQLKQIIKEELESVMQERELDITDFRTGKTIRSKGATMAMNAFRRVQSKLDRGPGGFVDTEVLKPGHITNIFKGRLANSEVAKEIKMSFQNVFNTMVDGGLPFEQSIEVIEEAGREVGLPTEGVVSFLKKQTSKDGRSNVTIDDPMMQ